MPTATPQSSAEVKVAALRDAAAQLREPTDPTIPAAELARLAPATAAALADWLDGEAAVQTQWEPFVELVACAITNTSGTIGELVIGRDDNGDPQMHADSSPAALRLAHHLLGISG